MKPRPLYRNFVTLGAGMALALGLWFGPMARPAAGQAIVNDPPHTVQTIIHYIGRAYEIYQKAQQIRRQVESIQNQVLALKKLANPNWREVASLLGVLDHLIREGQSLAYSLADIDAQFHATFPGWAGYTNPMSDRKTQVTRALDTMRKGLATVGRSSRLITDQYTLGDIKKTMATIKGHQEALELLATIGTFNAEEQILTRQALGVQSNLAAVYYGYRLNQEAQTEATHLANLERTLASARRVRSPGFTFRPGWSNP